MLEPGSIPEIGVIDIPGLEDEGEPEYQVAPMVDVLLVLLLFFMATATTEVVNQTADLALPLAENSKTKEEEAGSGQILINIEKLNYKIKIGNTYYDTADSIIPEIQRQKEVTQALAGSNLAKFRVLIRADKDTPFNKITELMQACAKAGVPDVIFGVSNPPDAPKGGASTP